MKTGILTAMTAVVISAGAISNASAQQMADWSGWYAGLHAGGGFGSADWVDNSVYTGGGPGTPILSADPDGVIGGVHLGYNWQTGYYVFGLEGSFDFSGLSASNPAVFVPTQDTDINWLVTVGPRLGYAMDSYMIYLKGGYAAADVETFAVNGLASVYPTKEVHHGGFVGIGAEVQVTEAITFGGEYNYVMLADKVHNGTASGFGPLSIRVEDVNIHTVTARVSVKLDKLFGN